MSVNIENALKITGWMEDHSLVWLAEQAAIHNSIVEVGCWRGKSTTCLADNTSGIVYAVDHWKGSEEHQPVDEEKLYQMFLDQMAPSMMQATTQLNVQPMTCFQATSM
jgi:hypothetical protein